MGFILRIKRIETWYMMHSSFYSWSTFRNSSSLNCVVICGIIDNWIERNLFRNEKHLFIPCFVLQFHFNESFDDNIDQAGLSVCLRHLTIHNSHLKWTQLIEFNVQVHNYCDNHRRFEENRQLSIHNTVTHSNFYLFFERIKCKRNVIFW